MTMKLIGIAGTNGSGKDTLGELLARDHQWLFVSVSDMLRDEARKRGQPVEREVLRTISAEWRREHGLGVLVDKAVALFNASPGKYKGLVVVPMRNPGEAQHLRDLGGTLVWIDADPKVRYERMTQRQRSAEDKKTFEQFIAEEQAEMQHSGDAAALSMADVKAMADIFLQNDSNDAKAFESAAEKALQLK